jgi:hypothetical protein
MTIVLLILLTAACTFAKHKKVVRHPSADALKLRAVTQFGDNVTQFEIRKNGSAYVLEMESTMHAKRSNAISAKNVDYLIRKFDKLPDLKSVPESCSRSQMTIEVRGTSGKTETKASCIGVKSISSEAFESFANLLVQAL